MYKKLCNVKQLIWKDIKKGYTRFELTLMLYVPTLIEKSPLALLGQRLHVFDGESKIKN